MTSPAASTSNEAHPNTAQENTSLEGTIEHDPLDEILDSDFPGTLRLTAIMVSLMLSIFLVSSATFMSKYATGRLTFIRARLL